MPYSFRSHMTISAVTPGTACPTNVNLYAPLIYIPAMAAYNREQRAATGRVLQLLLPERYRDGFIASGRQTDQW
jgi:hypothetical protein